MYKVKGVTDMAIGHYYQVKTKVQSLLYKGKLNDIDYEEEKFELYLKTGIIVTVYFHEVGELKGIREGTKEWKSIFATGNYKDYFDKFWETFGVEIKNFGKETRAIKKMLNDGYTQEDIFKAMDYYKMNFKKIGTLWSITYIIQDSVAYYDTQDKIKKKAEQMQKAVEGAEPTNNVANSKFTLAFKSKKRKTLDDLL